MGIKGRGTLRGGVLIVRSGLLREGGTLRGGVLIVRSGLLRGGGTLRGWVLIVRSGLLRGGGTLRGWVRIVRSGLLRGLGSYCRKYGYHDYGSIGESLLTFFGSLTYVCFLLSDEARAIMALR